MATPQPCSLPQAKEDQAYVEVSALDGGFVDLPTMYFVLDVAQEKVPRCPSLAFYIVHIPTGTHLLFDLGLRRDIDACPPAVQAIVKMLPVTVPPGTAVEESLVAGGISPQSVQTVVLSHLHFDHIGNTSSFTNATFVLGAGSRELLENSYPSDPKSQIWPDAVPAERTRYLSDADFSTSIGPFPNAHDYFGDGSLYIVEAPGHCPGHVNILARTSSDGAWIYLAGDTAHDKRLITGEKEVAFRIDEHGHMLCAHAHKDDAVEHIRRVGSLLKVPRVHVLLAHDWEWYEENKGGAAFLPGKIPPM
ncbi:metallo-hydrolase/oxidoreductase [Phanerochaete sordida]|uniref:Metallo-hydrolase/oxidoreductase n=1 Tax=Phanerochaete sordida TaxID=48140 RepID=A0A9P3LI53_9APHY|nr:metallo-hydrolase/oxidoreductase [Phanerochaete sordida]